MITLWDAGNVEVGEDRSISAEHNGRKAEFLYQFSVDSAEVSINIQLTDKAAQPPFSTFAILRGSELILIKHINELETSYKVDVTSKKKNDLSFSDVLIVVFAPEGTAKFVVSDKVLDNIVEKVKGMPNSHVPEPNNDGTIGIPVLRVQISELLMPGNSLKYAKLKRSKTDPINMKSHDALFDQFSNIDHPEDEYDPYNFCEISNDTDEHFRRQKGDDARRTESNDHSSPPSSDSFQSQRPTFISLKNEDNERTRNFQLDQQRGSNQRNTETLRRKSLSLVIDDYSGRPKSLEAKILDGNRNFFDGNFLNGKENFRSSGEMRQK